MQQREEIDWILSNPYFEVVAYFSVALLLLAVFLFLFEVVPSYKTWEQIVKGNAAVAMAVGGKIYGICNILRYSLLSSEGLYVSLTWAAYGFVLLMITYFLFEFLTPVFRVDTEIAQDNRAVGFLSMVVSIALSYVVGATIH